MSIVMTKVALALMPVLSTILTWAISAAALAAKRRWGIEIEARHREALHSALLSGIQAALGRGLKGDAAVQAAVDYAGASVPDAIRKLRPVASVLSDLAAAKLRAIAAAK